MSVIVWVTKNLLSRAPPCFGSHWACVVGYGPFSLCVIHKEGLCTSNGYDDDEDGDTVTNKVT
jgi:hypothetical protein